MTEESRSRDGERAARHAPPVSYDIGVPPPELRALIAKLVDIRPSDPDPRLRPVGRARKVSVSMPEDLMVAVQQRVGRGEFSQYVTEAVAKQFERDLLADLSAMLHAEHGPVSDEAMAQARRTWPAAQ